MNEQASGAYVFKPLTSKAYDLPAPQNISIYTGNHLIELRVINFFPIPYK